MIASYISFGLDINKRIGATSTRYRNQSPRQIVPTIPEIQRASRQKNATGDLWFIDRTAHIHVCATYCVSEVVFYNERVVCCNVNVKHGWKHGRHAGSSRAEFAHD